MQVAKCVVSHQLAVCLERVWAAAATRQRPVPVSHRCSVAGPVAAFYRAEIGGYRSGLYQPVPRSQACGSLSNVDKREVPETVLLATHRVSTAFVVQNHHNLTVVHECHFAVDRVDFARRCAVLRTGLRLEVGRR